MTVTVYTRRELRDWRWELRSNKKVALINKKTGQETVLDKVRLMSFIKFAPNCLDKMRIEDCKKLRKQMREIRAKKRVRNSRTIHARANIKKEK